MAGIAGIGNRYRALGSCDFVGCAGLETFCVLIAIILLLSVQCEILYKYYKGSL